MKIKKDLKYVILLVSILGAFVAIEVFTPKPTNWVVTLSHKDKIPFGTYVLHKLYEEGSPKKIISNSYNTIYELGENESQAYDFLILAENFSPGKEDINKLLQLIYNGSNALVSANYFGGIFADTLKLETADQYLETKLDNEVLDKDSISFYFTNPNLPKQGYKYKLEDVSYYLKSIDTLNSRVLAKNSRDKIISIVVPFGEGKLHVNTTPLAFTNNYLLLDDNYKFASQSLSYLGNNNLHWTEFYQLGRMEASSPIRFILSQPALRWAYGITAIALLLFVIFEAKRKQRIIPIIKPLQNTSLEFARTVGNLYFNSGNHKNIAEKKILFFIDSLKSKYYLNNTKKVDSFFDILAGKSGKAKKEVISLFNFFEHIQNKRQISKEELMTLNKKIEDFYKN